MNHRSTTLQPMKINAKDDVVLRKYLLGDLSVEEQEEVELWLMSDEDAYGLLEAAEDDLIDDSLAGRLTQRDLDLFNNHFLAAPERQRKVQFSRSFKRALDAASPPAPTSAPLPHASSTWARFLDALRYRPALAYAGSALLIVLLASGLWSLFTAEKLRQELRSTTDQLANVGRDRDDLKRQLQESQAATRTLEAQFRTLEASIAATKSSSPAPVLLAVNLMPGITRSSSDVPKVTLTANTALVRFSLALLDDNFRAYRVSLMNADGREVWSQDKVAATAGGQGKVIELTVPAQLLSNGDYSFNLMGLPNSGIPENISRYSFRTTH